MKKRYHLIFSGTVQGIGFRATAHTLAIRHRLRGWVRNNRDGRVEAIVEGEKDELEVFLASLHKHFDNYIRGCERDVSAANGEFKDFSITF